MPQNYLHGRKTSCISINHAFDNKCKMMACVKTNSCSFKYITACHAGLRVFPLIRWLNQWSVFELSSQSGPDFGFPFPILWWVKKKPTLASIHDWVLLIPAPQSLYKMMSDHYDLPLAKLPWGWFSQNSLLFWWIFGGISHSGQITLTLGCKFNFAWLHSELKSISLLNRRVPIAKIFPNIAYLTIL